MAIRNARETDLSMILSIYNQGIEDRIATLESEPKDLAFITNWFEARQGRYFVIVAEENDNLVGWASVNPYHNRSAYQGVGDISVYIHRDHRGKGIGQGLYLKRGFREVGVFKNHGILDGRFVDVLAMEKVLIKKLM
ncbi:MAG TPA: GNAT family N-acetyltransferase [Bacilli bacterium]|nr:GNAT family N-acetyltransferase [Bacilli bacterium]